MSPMPKKNPLDKRIPTAFSVSRRTLYAFRDKCKELDISASDVTEELLKQFIRENTKL